MADTNDTSELQLWRNWSLYLSGEQSTDKPDEWLRNKAAIPLMNWRNWAINVIDDPPSITNEGMLRLMIEDELCKLRAFKHANTPPLPQGWSWTEDGAASHDASVRICERGFVTVDGDVSRTVMAAVLNRSAGAAI